MNYKRLLIAGLMIISTLTIQISASANRPIIDKIKSNIQNSSTAEDDKKAVQVQLDKLTRAIMGGEAKIIANLWTEDGTYIDDDGNIFQGRNEIEKYFASVFESSGGFVITVSPQKFQLLDKNVALSEGLVSQPDNGHEFDTRYSIILVKSNGNWLISSATETPFKASSDASQLNQLDWLIGDWKAQNSTGASVHMTSQWAGNKSFIVCRIEAAIPDQDKEKRLETQIIGWDPRVHKIVSWHFDYAGGYGHGAWSYKNNKWFITSTGVLNDGRMTQALNIISMNDPNSFSWQSVDRSVDGINLPDTNELKIQRTTGN